MNETDAAPGPAVPPELRPDALPGEEPSRWPKVIGVISLIYALGGMLCGLGYAGSTLFTEALLAMGGMTDVDLPTPIKVTVMVLVGLGLILGVMLLIGAVKLLQRKRSGVRLHRRWAVLRMTLMFMAAVTMLFTADASVNFEKARLEATNRMIEQQGQSPRPIPSDETLYRKTIITAAVIYGIQSIYPLFLGFYLSRRTISQQIEHWPSR